MTVIVLKGITSTYLYFIYFYFKMPSILNLIPKCVTHNYFQNISGYDIRENFKSQDYI